MYIFEPGNEKTLSPEEEHEFFKAQWEASPDGIPFTTHKF